MVVYRNGVRDMDSNDPGSLGLLFVVKLAFAILLGRLVIGAIGAITRRSRARSAESRAKSAAAWDLMIESGRVATGGTPVIGAIPATNPAAQRHPNLFTTTPSAPRSDAAAVMPSKTGGLPAASDTLVNTPIAPRTVTGTMTPSRADASTFVAKSPPGPAAAKLSARQLAFLRSQRIPVSELFDATGLKRDVYATNMRRDGQKFAYGTKPCANGHTIRTRAGHCIQCDTSRIAFALRHHRPGYVYIAGSAQTHLLKVGTTIDLLDRGNKLKDHAYGGAHDWEILLSAHVENAGSIEFLAQNKLWKYSTAGSYVRDGRVQNCYELFKCSYEEARAAVVSSLPPDTAVRATNEGRSHRLWQT